MPKVEIEILRTVTITRDESVTVEVNIPQRILDNEYDNPGELYDWVERELGKESSALRTATDAAGWDHTGTDEDTEYDEVNVLSEDG